MSLHSIVMLGPSGSGKTTFMASMYKRLKLQRQETNFFLSPELNEGNALDQMYQQLLQGQMPDKTAIADVHNWAFDCRVTTPKGTFNAFQLQYLDYAGERLDRPINPTLDPHPQFQEHLSNADSVLGLLDGLLIYDFMRDKTKLGPLHSNISAVMRHIQSNRNLMRSPIHFVITKWDIFGDGATMAGNDMLQRVRDTLLSFEDFRDFISNRPNRNAPMRLIPVSSLGKGYMQLLPTGQLRPVLGVIPSPYQVEYPIACALVDRMREEMATAVQRETTGNALQSGTNIAFRIFQELVKRLDNNRLRKMLPEQFREIDEELLTFFRDLVTNEAVKRADQLRLMQAQALGQVKDQRTAFNFVLENLAVLERTLEETYPASLLARPDALPATT